MGPLLFNIFKNDIFYFLESLCCLYNYADDDTISHSDHDIENLQYKLSNASVQAVNWFRNNGMQANAPKFQVAFFSRTKDVDSITVTVNDVILKSQSNVKLLGVTVDGKLKFDKHVSDICKKAAVQVNGLSRLALYLPKKSLFNIYVCYVVSNFLYCPLAWHFCSKISTMKMEKVQERALRIILNDCESDYKNLLIKTNRLSLYTTRLQLIVTEVFKATQGMSPSFINELFTIKRQNYEFRDKNMLEVPSFKTIGFGKYCLSYLGPYLWNSLKINCKDVKSLNEFREVIRTWRGPMCKCGYCLVCLYSYSCM